MRKRICIVVASEMTARTFLRPWLAALAERFGVTLVVNQTTRTLKEDLGLPIEVASVPIERRPSWDGDLRALQRLTSLFRKGRFDLVHAVTPKAGLLAMAAGFAARVPVRMNTFTGQIWFAREGASRLFLKGADQLIASLATHVLADSPSQREFMIAERVARAKRCVVLGNGSISGVDSQRFRPDPEARARVRARLGIPEQDTMLLFLGRLSRDKGLPDLGHAYSRLAARHPGLRLVIVGVDEQNVRPALMDACAEHLPRLHFVDFADKPEEYFAAADIFCLPSYREGFGVVVLEAASAGVPAVASRIYGVTDAVEEGETGLLHEPKNIDDITRALDRLIQDPSLRRRMGAAARQRAIAKFSQEYVVRDLLALYESVLGPGEPGPVGATAGHATAATERA